MKHKETFQEFLYECYRRNAELMIKVEKEIEEEIKQGKIIV